MVVSDDFSSKYRPVSWFLSGYVRFVLKRTKQVQFEHLFVNSVSFIHVISVLQRFSVVVYDGTLRIQTSVMTGSLANARQAKSNERRMYSQASTVGVACIAQHKSLLP